MIYFFTLIVGFFNGFFSSGAGQILVFYLIFIKKEDTYKSRALSVLLISISSFMSLFFLINFEKIKIFEVLFLIVESLIFAIIGTKIMKKINSNILNLISGILISVLSLIRFITLR